MNTHDGEVIWWKLFWTWLAVGVSQMSPLEVVQAMAALGALVYSAVQTWLLVRDRILSNRAKRKGR